MAKVFLFHPAQIPPKDYGGVERVVLWLARGLKERGNEVWVGAAPGSKLPEGIRVLEFPPEKSSAWDLLHALPKGIDIVHFMAPPEEGVLQKLPCPGLLTVHGNGKPGEIFPRNSVFISRNHAERHGASAFVYNGLDPNEYIFTPDEKKDWFLFLAKTSWSVKNLPGAIAYCERARVGLRVAGGTRPYRTRARVFAQSLLRPAHRKIRWLGPVAGDRKARALAQARALVFPVIWPEPFGLAVVEALLSGTPVLASARGSLPELVTPEVGAIVGSDEEWIDWLKRDLLPWKPSICREVAVKRFHYRVMAEGYEAVYRKLAAGEPLNETEPVAGDWRKQ